MRERERERERDGMEIGSLSFKINEEERRGAHS
jgi:hypothetical protein